MRRQQHAVTVETAPWKPDGWIAPKDFVTAAKLGCCFVAASMPARCWPAASRLMARAHLQLRPQSIRVLEPSTVCRDHDARSLAQDALAADYLANIRFIREILPGGWPCDLPLAGRDVLDQALRDSRGAVLWCAPFVGGDLAIKKALVTAGYSLTQLSSPFHPFATSRFGTRFLNPVRLSAVNRYLIRRVLVVYGNSRPALDVLRQVLTDNGVVSIVAVGTGKISLTFPFLGGIIDLALGGPLLAYETGAALIPVFTLPDPNRGYRIELGPRLTHSPALSKQQALHAMTARYVELLEPIVRAHPAQWEGWFHPATWRPSA